MDKKTSEGTQKANRNAVKSTKETKWECAKGEQQICIVRAEWLVPSYLALDEEQQEPEECKLQLLAALCGIRETYVRTTMADRSVMSGQQQATANQAVRIDCTVST